MAAITKTTNAGAQNVDVLACLDPNVTGSPKMQAVAVILGDGTIMGAGGASPPLGASEAHIGQVGGTTANPTSVLTRPSDTTPYGLNDIIASSTTAGSVVVPSFTASRIAAGSGAMRRFRLNSNITTGWDSVVLQVDFWTTAPTFTNGDNGAYAVATGAAGFIGRTSITLEQLADGAVGIGVPAVGSEIGFKLASSSLIYWTLKITTGTPTPTSGQTFTITPEIYQD